MNYVIDPPPQVALPIHGAEEAHFPVRRVYCVGRNYAAHAREMGADPDKEPPFFFQKSPDNLIPGGGEFPYPGHTADVHPEVELMVALQGGGADIPEARALEAVYGYGVGLDMTRRDLQQQAKDKGRPWEVAKAFEHSAPCSALVPAAAIGHPATGAIWLTVNGAPRQQGDLAQMIWSPAAIIAALSTLFTLAPGDVIFTGTPAGVGPVVRGDHLLAGVAGVGELAVTVV